MPEKDRIGGGRTVKWLVLAGPAFLVMLILAPDPPLAIEGLVSALS